MSERERQVMIKLKEVVDKQRDEIRAKDRELTLKNEDIEAVSDFISHTRYIHFSSLVFTCASDSLSCSNSRTD